MKSFVSLSLVACFLLIGHINNAQSIFYQHDSGIHVYAYGHEQLLPWCGGFNNSQFAMCDLNNDSLQDLVVYDVWTGLRTFLNIGSPSNPRYIYAPEYALNFPPVFDYIVLADYNCDGIADLWHRGGTGYEVYTGYYNSLNQLCFTFKQDIYYDNLHVGGTSNAYVNPGDVPAVVDIDGDGDPDLVSYDVLGQTLYWYRNMRVEYGLPCDSLLFHLEDECWSKVHQQYWRAHVLGYSCSDPNLILPKHSGSGEKTTHSGNTPCLFDWDMDGDIDYLDGSISFNNMTFLKNGKIELGLSRDSMIYQDTLWQSTSGGKTIDLPLWPAAFNIDIDQDGKKDLLIAPNSPSPNSSENHKCVWYYKNLSTPGSPNWQFQSDSFLVDQSIDVGTAAYPMLYDYNRDGKPDLFVGSDGYYQPATGLLKSRISYYKNTSTSGNPSFTLVTDDFMDIDSNGFVGTAPAFGDIDNDGKDDMVIGHTDGTISYYKNIAVSNTVQPSWQLIQTVLTDINGIAINVTNMSAPFIYDVDCDGKPDLVIGNIYGSFEYYKNVSTVAGVKSLRLSNVQLGNAVADPNATYLNYSTPYIGKIDSTNNVYLLSGSGSGNIYRFGGIASCDTNAIYLLLDTQYSFIDSQFLYYNHGGTTYGAYEGLRSSLTVGDIIGDGGREMIVGNIRGGLEMYKLKIHWPEDTNNKITNENGRINVFPNPANETLNVVWSNIAAPEINISIVNMDGQRILTTTMPTIYKSTAILVGNLPDGLYICIFQNGVNRYYNKFTILR